VIGVAAILLIGIVVAAYSLGGRFIAPESERAIESVAVLPFENKSGNADSEYLSDGLAESLIYRLSQLSNLKVSPRSSVFRYKGKEIDAEKIGNELGVSLQDQYIHNSVPSARTQAQAERAENQIREAIYERRYDPGKKLFSEFVDETFLPWSRANKRSYREDEQRSVTLKDFFGEKHLRDIKPMMIEKFKRERLATPTMHDKPERPKPRSPASVNRDLACLSKILSMAFDNELIDSNPMRRVRLLKENGSRERFITADEEVKLFAKLTGRRDHIRCVVTIALNTGMRRGEILGLQWEHVNFLARTILVEKSKTGKPRTIPMNDRASGN
jgi:integrase-like protein